MDFPLAAGHGPELGVAGAGGPDGSAPAGRTGRPHSTPVGGKRRNDERDADDDMAEARLAPPSAASEQLASGPAPPQETFSSPGQAKRQRRLDMSSDDDDDDDPEDGSGGVLPGAPLYADDEEQAMAADDPMSLGAPSGANGGAGIDDTFFELCRSFAQIELPQAQEGVPEVEHCPLCPQVFPLSLFAVHVYQCIRQLDEVEQKHQMQLDEKMAARIQQREFPSQVFEEALDKFKPEKVCSDGASCRRTDQRHFILKSHPRVTCPLCSDEFEVYSINSHISLCMDSEQPEESQPKRISPAAAVSLDQAAAVEADAEAKDEAEMGDDGDQLMRSPSASTLTAAQMKAMAGMVVQQKSLPPAQQDVSLHKLLETFASLGFTKDSLSNELRSRSAGASAASDDPPQEGSVESPPDDDPPQF